jgi:DNA primase
MSSENNLVVNSIVRRILGDPKDEYDGIVQYEYNCPSSYCRSDADKFNLAYHSERHIFHCWKCKYKGFVKRIADDYGIQDDIDKINLIFPKAQKAPHAAAKGQERKGFDDDVTCELPEGFHPLSERRGSKFYKRAVAYLLGRKVDWDTITKYNIGYTEDGPRKFRIIIPSLNINGKVNYYEARSYIPSVKPTYLKPDSPDKQDVIFNVKNINFNLPVYLVEGVFDMFPIPNAIPLLGKSISDYLVSKLSEHQSKVVICLDEDAKKDACELYSKLEGIGLDVWFVEVRDDIAKVYQDHGRPGVIELLGKRKKLDFNQLFADKLKNKKRGSMKQVNHDYVRRDFERLKKNINE